MPDPRGNPEHLNILEQWLRSYQPDRLFDETGRPAPEVLAACPKGDRRIGRNPQANGGQFRTDLSLPDIARYAANGPEMLAQWLRDVLHRSEAGRNLRFFCPERHRRQSPDADPGGHGPRMDVAHRRHR